ncbi:hypothetical protein ITP31_003902 [Salmonella enterica]|uniref:hypothetical protein n=1 Tax=Serratia phage PCH45 TaxID=2608368 RepID=UPI0012AA67D7|nr:hypothetical protein [Salmonella enterica]QFP93183.1 hypothetical protein [Serratia phage PCH45]
MQLFSFLTAKGRACNKARKLFKGKEEVPVNVDNALICVAGIRSIYLNKKLMAATYPTTLFGLYFTPEKLEKEFESAIQLILSEDQPERRRYPPQLTRTKLDNWLWTDKGDKPIEWEQYIVGLLAKAENFLCMLRDSYEIEGKAIAGYRLEQMYYPLCDIISIAEAFFNEVAKK